MARGVAEILRRSAPALLTATLVACGGGGGTTTYNVSGVVSAAAGTMIDADTNDPFSSSTPNANNTSATAQAVPSTVVIGGFAAATPTGDTVLDDVFASQSDTHDYYSATLSAGQKVTLKIADAGVDLDLYLVDGADGTTVVQSSVAGPLTATESITVAASGSYYVVVLAASGYSNYTLNLAQGGLAAGVPDPEFVPGELLVRFAPNSLPANTQSEPLWRAAQFGLTALGGGSGRTMLFSLPEDESARAMAFAAMGVEMPAHPFGSTDMQEILSYHTQAAAKALSQRADVLSADLNYIHKPLAVPNDQYYSYQWHYPLINLPQAWDIETGDASTIVAVVDTGVLLGHPDLSGQLVSGYDFISSPTISVDGDGIDNNPDDPGDGQTPGQSSFHGTHVAGTIAAASNNGSGVAGIAWGAKIMPIRVLGQGGGTSYDIIQGVRYASGLSNDSGTILSEAQKADVLNLSLGCNNCYSSAEEAEYVAARAAGSIIIAAAGNENTASLGYPASYDGVVSVSALDRFKQRAPYSNFGTRIDVAAPGGDNSVDADGDGYADGVLSTAGDDSSGTRQATYKFENGTSMASPHMAGVVALMKSANPSFITPDQLDTLLSSGAITEDVAGNGATVRDDIYGYGMIDALKAVQAAQGGVTPTTLAVAPTSLSFASAVSSQTLTLSAQGGGTVVVNGVTPSAAWLSATGTGLGDYTVSVDRTGFGDGTYPANLIVNYTINGTTSEINVPVTMTVGTATTGAGDTGYTWMVLLDPDTNTTVQTQRAANNNGQYAFTFTGIADGSYYVVAGSDSDNDFILCDAGESCGGYPTLGQLQQITVSGGDVTGINFISLFDVNFGTAAASAQQEEFSGFSRQPAAQKEME